MAIVLCTGIDEGLLKTRKWILEQAGHIVITARDQVSVIAACKQRAIDVAVIGQTVSSNSKKLIASLVRQHSPSAKILELHQAHQERAVEDADSWLEVPAGVPQDLADRVGELATT
ncbi:MAG TPA: hypothetical protein VI636_24150 [Candidatus Angelobacter sp.]